MTDPQPYPVPIRISSAGHCPRQQAYASLEYEPSDPPDRQSLNRMALGDAAENILVNNLGADGWTVTHTRAVEGGEQLSIGLTDPPMTGHPDGVCRHPKHTGNRRLTLECKSMSSDRLRTVIAEGIVAVYPDYLAQVALYARILYQTGIVDEPRQAVFAYMDRDGNQPAPEIVTWDEEYEAGLRRRLSDTWEQIREYALPERPYPADDPHCRYCRFFTLCQGQVPTDWRELPQPLETQSPELLAAARRWLEADAARKEARATLLAACPDPEHPGLIAGDVTVSWFIPSQPGSYDEDELRRLLTADQMKDIARKPRTEPAFWIRAQRQRRR